MAESMRSAEDYRRRAADMKAQAERAETVYLQALYASIADNWDQLAEQMRVADQGKDNWEKLAENMTHEAQPAPQNANPRH